ncbi:hypothetical protein GW17_00026892 [Ensete ventricosum]|nr:hypothetical protein GW17_00026892 [Ensete ventricosum]
MRLGTCQECVESSPRISGACQDDARKFARRRPRLAGRLSGDLAEGIGKIVRNTPGDRRRKTVRLAAGEAEGCRFAGVRSLSLVNHPYPGIRAVSRPGRRVNCPYPDFPGEFDFWLQNSEATWGL